MSGLVLHWKEGSTPHRVRSDASEGALSRPLRAMTADTPVRISGDGCGGREVT